MFESRRWLVVAGLFALVVAGAFAVLRSGKRLPRVAQRNLDEYIVKIAGEGTDYEVLSVQRSPGQAGDADMLATVTFTGHSGAVSGCPDPSGGEATWCVVLDRGVADGEYSHFLVQQLGGIYNVGELEATEQATFEYFGCTNWDQGARMASTTR